MLQFLAATLTPPFRRLDGRAGKSGRPRKVNKTFGIFRRDLNRENGCTKYQMESHTLICTVGRPSQFQLDKCSRHELWDDIEHLAFLLASW